jgi:uncharacterized repeat protein (TIGR01451 family)
MTDSAEQKQKFHHRHFPHFIKWGKAAWWRFSHLYFVIFIHYMTDKYDGKKHHLVVDTIYGVVTFGLVAVNIGIGVWFIQHTEPPDFELDLITASTVTSGRTTDIAAVYASKNRDVENVRVSVYTPEDFVKGGEPSTEPHTNDLGIVEAGTADILKHQGVMLGNQGDVHSVSAIVQYDHQGQTYYDVAHRTLEVSQTSFDASVNFPKNVAAGFSTEGEIRFHNKSDLARKNVQFTLSLPANFTLEGITYKKENLDYNAKKNRIRIPKIAARTKGKIKISGYFVSAQEQPGVVGGDQESQIGVSVRSEIAGLTEEEKFYVNVPGTYDTVRVIEPRVAAFVTATPVARFGEGIVYTATVSNTGDDDAENIQLYGTLSGSGVFGGTVAFPTIKKIKQGVSKTVSITVPTGFSGEINPVGRILVTGSAYSPLVDFDIPIEASVAETRFTSQATLSASSVYSGPGGEQLGFGPNPPEPNEPTAFLVFMRVDNTNNALTGTTVTTTLPSQVQWTGQMSVASGNPIQYDPSTRTVSWTVGTLPPQSTVQGAQFEVVVLPNEQQVGLSLPLTNGWTVNATDSFTGQFVSAFTGAVVTPPVVESTDNEDGIDEIIIEDNPLGEIVIE